MAVARAAAARVPQTDIRGLLRMNSWGGPKRDSDPEIPTPHSGEVEMELDGGESAGGRATYRRRLLAFARLGICSSATFCVVAFALPAVTGAIIVNSTNHIAPYPGGTYSANNWVQTQCASKNRLGILPHWSNTTGVGGWTASATAKSCLPAIGVASGGIAGTFFSIAIPLRIPSGAHSVQVNAHIIYSGARSIHLGGPCPAVRLDANGNGQESCSISAQFCFSFCIGGSLPYLWDSTNNTYVYSGTSFPVSNNYTYLSNYTSCSAFKCTYSNSTYSGIAPNSVNTVFTWYFNSTMVKTHRYWAVITFSSFAYSEVQNYPRSTASASFNIGSLGNGLNLTSIAIV